MSAPAASTASEQVVLISFNMDLSAGRSAVISQAIIELWLVAVPLPLPLPLPELQLLFEPPELEHEELPEVLVPVLVFLQEKIRTAAGLLVPPKPGSVAEGKSKAIASLPNKMNKAKLLKYIFLPGYPLDWSDYYR